VLGLTTILFCFLWLLSNRQVVALFQRFINKTFKMIQMYWQMSSALSPIIKLNVKLLREAGRNDEAQEIESAWESFEDDMKAEINKNLKHKENGKKTSWIKRFLKSDD